MDVVCCDVIGQVGPAQACGLICVGDVLVGVGDDRVKGLSFPSILGEVYHAVSASDTSRGYVSP